KLPQAAREHEAVRSRADQQLAAAIFDASHQYRGHFETVAAQRLGHRRDLLAARALKPAQPLPQTRSRIEHLHKNLADRIAGIRVPGGRMTGTTPQFGAGAGSVANKCERDVRQVLARRRVENVGEVKTPAVVAISGHRRASAGTDSA